MRRIDYVARIAEDSDRLLQEERKAGGKLRQHLQLLRLLKSSQAETMAQASVLVGLSSSRAPAMWQRYQEHGLSSLLHLGYKGSRCKLNAGDQERLQKRLEEGFRAAALRPSQRIELHDVPPYSPELNPAE